jgi:diguanylate cyclase (GGDEF)-like protein
VANPETSSDTEIKISPKIKFIQLRNLLTTVAGNLSDLLDSKCIGIYLQGRESGNWALAVSLGINDTVEESARIINHEKSTTLKKALDAKQVCLLEEILDLEYADMVKGENLIVTPMYSHDDVMALLLADFDAFASLTNRHLLQLELAAHLIKTAIEKEFLSLQVSQLKEKLTNPVNKTDEQYLQNENLIHWLLEREIERCDRHGGSLAVFAVSIDNLAYVISQYGQTISSKAVLEVFEAMNRLVRKCDLFTQMTSDSFICLSQGQNAAGAHVLAERLKHRAKETICMIDNQRITMTVSIGITLYPNGRKSKARDLIDRSQQALKKAQPHGNRVVIWRPENNQ